MSAIVISAAFAVGLLSATGIYLLLSRNAQRVCLGFLLISNATNLAVLSSSGLQANAVPPLLPAIGEVSEPLPQAFILTAIVIGLGTSAFLLALVQRLNREIETEDARGKL